MEQRQRVVEALLALPHRTQPALVGIPVAGCQLVGLGQHAALGLTGGAGGVEDAGGGVAGRFTGLGGCGSCGQGLVRNIFQQRHRRLVPGQRQCGLDRALAGGQRHDQIDLGMIHQVGQFPWAVIGVDRHAANAQRIQCQFVQDVLGAAFQEQAHAVTQPIARGAVERRECVDRSGGLRVADLASRWVVGAGRVGGNCQQAVGAVGLRGALECVAYRGGVVNGNHGGP